MTAFGQIDVVNERAIQGHIDQKDILAGRWEMPDLIEAGRRLFIAKFTKADGLGRPASTGSTNPQVRAKIDQLMLRSAGPDANSCLACHNDPFVGGAGDFVANVFVGLGERKNVNYSLSSEFSAERGTPDLNGLGIVELLAREITEDLHAIRALAIRESIQLQKSVSKNLTSKGIDFGVIEAHPDESLDLQRVEGIDHDLVVKPFNQKGTVTSLREFTINALNLHHGMQADERFGTRQTGSEDFDQDGIPRELTDGDVTALTLFQATLSLPGVCLPADLEMRSQIEEGQRLFSKCKCSDCHIPELELRSPVFSEPSPYNVRGTNASSSPGEAVLVDLSCEMQTPKLARDSSGKFMIRVFSDFKRHAIADKERPYWNNETTEQRLVPSNVFVTKRLWSVGNTAPYGHRGDVSTIFDAISYHGAEANESRAKFDLLNSFEQDCIIKFLKSLQIVPQGESLVRVDPEAKTLPYQK